ncbi:hypothetical protein [Yinghuangia seranimata]|uniref:hypothetical protein n=1 Tax=Yinghuangia seranimata TaxID=408067 RepID=UPI00248A938E|nr:hypothetical protein [Yinghuangia seranimata]MDI2130521.1 hypothetical protein [Yinghuangia seranimata]
MGSPSFQVDVDGMKSMVTKLRNAETAMRDAMSAMHSTGGAENIGTAKLDDACNTFQKKWNYGIGELHKDIEATVKGLDDVMNAYAEVDKGLADAFPAQGK